MPYIPTRHGNPGNPSMLVQSLTTLGTRYELRYTRCGKQTCSHCSPNAADLYGHVGHGPYWYLCLIVHKKPVRVYIGHDLDTSRFRTVDGNLDWPAIFKVKTNRATQKSPTCTPPPQLTPIQQIVKAQETQP
jgi:hypothetical protein